MKLLRYLLAHHRRVTLLVMTGLMVGSMRALWPWQATVDDGDASGALLAPYSPVAGPILLAAVGVLAVVALIAAESRAAARPR